MQFFRSERWLQIKEDREPVELEKQERLGDKKLLNGATEFLTSRGTTERQCQVNRAEQGGSRGV